MDPKHKKLDKMKAVTSKMLSVDYRKVSFGLSLVGSDPVVKAYNELMQYFFNWKSESPATSEDVLGMLERVGDLLLEIRRSMGNETTELDNFSMVEWFISDLGRIRTDVSSG